MIRRPSDSASRPATSTGRPVWNSALVGVSWPASVPARPGRATTIRSASRPWRTSIGSSHPILPAQAAEGPSAIGMVAVGTPASTCSRSKSCLAAVARAAFSRTPKSTSSCTSAPDIPSPTNGTACAGSMLTCAPRTCAPNWCAIANAVRKANRLPSAPSIGARILRIAICRPRFQSDNIMARFSADEQRVRHVPRMCCQKPTCVT